MVVFSDTSHSCTCRCSHTSLYDMHKPWINTKKPVFFWSISLGTRPLPRHPPGCPVVQNTCGWKRQHLALSNPDQMELGATMVTDRWRKWTLVKIDSRPVRLKGAIETLVSLERFRLPKRKWLMTSNRFLVMLNEFRGCRRAGATEGLCCSHQTIRILWLGPVWNRHSPWCLVSNTVPCQKTIVH